MDYEKSHEKDRLAKKRSHEKEKKMYLVSHEKDRMVREGTILRTRRFK